MGTIGDLSLSSGQNFCDTFGGMGFHGKRQSSGNFAARATAVALAAVGVGKDVFLGQERVEGYSVDFATHFAELFQWLATKLKANEPLAPELKRILAQTKDGKAWTAGRQSSTAADELKATLKAAFTSGKQPEIIRQEANLLRVIKVGDTEITVIGTDSTDPKFSNLKVLAPINGNDLRIVFDTKAEELAIYDSLKSLVSSSVKSITESPELSQKELENILKEGTIINSDLSGYIPAGKMKSALQHQLTLKHDDKLYDLVIDYESNGDPYQCSSDLSVSYNGKDFTIENSSGNLFGNKLREFNEAWNIHVV